MRFIVLLMKRYGNSDSALIKFPSHFIRAVTDSFSEDLKLGEDTVCCIYTNHSKSVAIKLLRQPSLLIREFQNCVERLESFHHPHIAKLVGFCNDGDDRCLVLAYSSNGSMAEVLRSDSLASDFTWKRRIRALCGISKALNFMHCRDTGRAVFHRAVKSSNVWLSPLYRSQLVDSGLSTYIESLEGEQDKLIGPTTTTLLGTRGYLCPHYVRTGSYDVKAEVYAFGVTMLEGITGRIQGDHTDIVGLYAFDEDALALAFDKRAGEWPADVIKELSTLVVGCLRQGREYLQRIPSIEPAMRCLVELESRWCAETEEEAAIRSQYTSLRSQLEERQRADDKERYQLQTELRSCIICFSEYSLHSGLACANGHFACDSCLSSHVRAQVESNRSSIATNDGQLFCPQHSRFFDPPCDAPALREFDIARHVTDAVFMQYLSLRRELWEHDVHRRRDALEEQLRQTISNEVTLQYRRDQERAMYQREIPNARMCGSCRFGPIGHRDCDNLMTHHREMTRSGRVINNACPNCGWFASDVNLWPPWDGVLWEERQAMAA
ncbi:hypothetical protein PINS_up014173 [Pythium insidiosum]|nr:hypothetical protein PINS_up014173 [Pythium insidiosum]